MQVNFRREQKWKSAVPCELLLPAAPRQEGVMKPEGWITNAFKGDMSKAFP